MLWIARLFSKRRPPHLATGLWGESLAADVLRQKGYRIVARRVAMGLDEIDLIAVHGRTLVFVEVKTRATEDFGRPSGAVTAAKRRRLSRAAVRYVMALREKPEYIRFDIVEIIGRQNGGKPQVRHIENAFSICGGYRLPW